VHSLAPADARAIGLAASSLAFSAQLISRETALVMNKALLKEIMIVVAENLMFVDCVKGSCSFFR
jgi:hypothetical protein